MPKTWLEFLQRSELLIYRCARGSIPRSICYAYIYGSRDTDATSSLSLINALLFWYSNISSGHPEINFILLESPTVAHLRGGHFALLRQLINQVGTNLQILCYVFNGHPLFFHNISQINRIFPTISYNNIILRLVTVKLGYS